MQKVNIAIFGFGFMGKTYLHASKVLNDFYPDLPLVQVKSILLSESKSDNDIKKIKDRYGIDNVTKDIKQILNDESIHAVYIGTPNNFHYEHYKLCIESKKHVLCDKPLGLNQTETIEMLQIANRNKDLISNVVFQYRFIPAITEIKKLISNGLLGKIFKFRISYLHGSYIVDRPITWRLKDKTGGALIDLGPHVVDLAYFLLGNFRVTHKKVQTKIEGRDVDDFAWFFCQTEKENADGFIEVSRVSTGAIDELRLEVHGSLGAIKWNLENLNFYELYSVNSNEKGYKKLPAFYDRESSLDFPPPKVTSGWLRSHIDCLYHFIKEISDEKFSSDKISKFSDGNFIQTIIDDIKNG
tara:strand:- start:130 stop:1194 length:1065 start_codon:yes stop_codon:yes gene_type:complete